VFSAGVSELTAIFADAVVAGVFLSRFGVSALRVGAAWLGVTLGYFVAAFVALGTVPGLFALPSLIFYGIGVGVLGLMVIVRAAFAAYVVRTPSYGGIEGRILPWYWALAAGLGVLGLPVLIVVLVAKPFKRVSNSRRVA
jgi:hypothetical protein